MTNEERDIIASFIARVSGAAAAQPGPWGGASVPATTAPALPPIDPEADRFITEQLNRYPEARYRLTQLAFVQEHALVEAQNRLKRMEWELQQTQQQAQQAQQRAAQPQQGGGFFSGLFGGGRQQAAPPPPPGGPWGQGAPPPGYQAAPPPQYAPGSQPGMFQRSGSGFLGSALSTAAGVAGGVLAADALRDLFSPRQALGEGFGGPGSFGGPFEPGGMPSADPGSVDQGTWTTPDPGAGAPDPGYVDTGNWDQGGVDPSAAPDQTDDQSGGGWDTGGGDSGSWDQGGGSDDDTPI